MNSSILVSGFVVVGVGAMVLFFAPFGSSDSSSEQAGTYQSAKVDANTVRPTTEISTNVDPEPFTWEDNKETVSGTDILDDLEFGDKKKVAEKKTQPEKKGTQEKAVAARDTSTSPVSTVSTGNEQAITTIDDDLDSFFGSPKPKKETTAKTKAVSKATKPAKVEPAFSIDPPKPAAAKVALQSATDSANTKSIMSGSQNDTSATDTSLAYQQGEETSASKSSDMFSFSPKEVNGTDDAPMLAPQASNDFEMPAIEPVSNDNMDNKLTLNSNDISGSLEPVAPAKPVEVAKMVNIKNPLQTRLTVTFLADGKQVSLKPGQHFQIRKTADLQVKFSVTRKEGWSLAQ